MKSKIAISLFFLFGGFYCLAQNQKKIDSLLALSQKTLLDTNKVKNLLAIADLYRGKDNRKAEEYALKAISSAQKIKWTAHYPALFMVLSKVKSNDGNYKEAIAILDSTMKYTGKKSDCECYTAEYLLQYQFCNSYSRNYPKATEYGLKALKKAEETKNLNQMARAYLRLGETKYFLNNYEGALKDFEKSFKLSKDNNFENILNLNRFMMAKIISQDNPERALVLQKEMISSYRKLKDSSQLAGALNDVGWVYFFKIKKLGEAKKYLDESYDIAKKVKANYFLPYICNNLSKVSLSSKNFDLAKKYNEEAFEIASKLDNKDALTTATSDLAHYYFVIHDFENAYLKESEITAIYGNARNKDVMKAVSEAEEKYQSEKKERMILEQKIQITNQRIWIFSILGLTILVLFGGLFIYSNHQAKQKAQFASEKLKLQTEKTSAIVEAEERERIRLAKELHDGVGPLLSIAKFQLENAMNQTKFNSIEQETLFQNANTMIDDAAREIRTVSHDLMPNALLMQGLVSAVREFVNRLSLSGKVKVSLDVANLDERLPQLTETVLYRVLQELVGNIIKHSNASSIQVQLIRNEKELTMLVEDNGKGFDTSQIANFNGIGLKNIMSRIDFLNGTVNFDSSLNSGTTVIVEVPL
ncbi:MAG TPA: sensor histidine kinase [Leadbetterella sp.]|nr:sensor histidine kinase [Leadbetterella sp.]